MNGCKTCVYYIREYDEFDNVSFYCHLTMKTIDKPIKNCRYFKPENKKRHIECQYKKIYENMRIILSVIDGRTENPDFKTITEQVIDTQNRMKEIEHWNNWYLRWWEV